jgi:hypothetical protein
MCIQSPPVDAWLFHNRKRVARINKLIGRNFEDITGPIYNICEKGKGKEA